MLLYKILKIKLLNAKNLFPLSKFASLLLIVLVFTEIEFSAALANPITPAIDGTGTTVTPNGNQFDIDGGAFSSDGANLFHSFDRFNLNQAQIANFLANPNLENILGRVVGGDPSMINGLIQVTGGNPNLYLMNPAGIVFGRGATLNVPGDFFATTATGIGLGNDKWFEVSGNNNYQQLNGNPSTFAFDLTQAGAIINAGNLTVNNQNSVGLIGGTVINTGEINASSGNILIQAVEGSNLVRISQPGQLLSLEIEPPRNINGQILPFTPLDVPQLLTGPAQNLETGLRLNALGQVEANNSGTVVPTQTGTTTIVGNLTNSAASNTFVGATNDIRIEPFNSNLEFTSGVGSINFKADSDSNGNGAFLMNANDSITVNGQDLIISGAEIITGNIYFPDGRVSLESQRDVTTGNIDSRTEGKRGIQIVSGGDVVTGNLVTSSRPISNWGIDSEADGGDINIIAGGSVTTGIINSEGAALAEGGSINIEAVDDINTGDIFALSLGKWSFSTRLGGDIFLTSLQGAITTGHIDSSTTNLPLEPVAAGNVYLNAKTTISTGNINTSTFYDMSLAPVGKGGVVIVTADSDINLGDVITNSSYWYGGDVLVQSNLGSIRIGNIDSSSGYDKSADAGRVMLNSYGTIEGGNITSRAYAGWRGTNLYSQSGGINVGDIEVTFLSVNANNAIEVGNIKSVLVYIKSFSNSIYTEDITASSAFTSLSGNININAATTIQTGSLTAYASSVRKGQVNLNAINDIEVDYIRNPDGVVNITTENQLRILETFQDWNGTEASISVASSTNNGSIQIRHGGNEVVPFIVGNPQINGTAAAITTGNIRPEQTINPTESFLSSHSQDSIEILTSAINSQNSDLNSPGLVDSTSPNSNSTLNSSVPTDNTIPNPNLRVNLLQSAILNNNSLLSFPSDFNNLNSFTPANFHSITEVDFSAESNSSTQSVLSFSNNFISNQNHLNSIATQENSRFDIAEALEQGDLENAVEQAESLRKQEYEDALGERLPQQIMNATQIRERLQEVAAQTGLSPAVVFALMVPNEDSEELALLLVRPEGEIVYKNLPGVNSAILQSKVREFRSDITEVQASMFWDNAQELYQWFIQPLEETLQEQQIDTLLFSLDSEMVSIPLSALHDGQQFVIEKYLYSLIPSYTLADARYTGVATNQLVAMGVAEFPDLEPLPAVPTEISTIASQSNSNHIFLNEEVTFNTLQNLRQQPFQIIHLATHADFQSSQEGSYIRLWNDNIKFDDLRQLSWSENPVVELLVLSACETAVGDRYAEMGFAGLAVKTGVKSALASLWQSNDLATLTLMVQFYQNLQEFPDLVKAEALRNAQLSLLYGEVQAENNQLKISGSSNSISLPPELGYIQNIDFSHPYFWSAFTVIGSPW